MGGDSSKWGKVWTEDFLWFATGQDKSGADQETCHAVEQRVELGTSYGGEQGRVCAQEKHL